MIYLQCNLRKYALKVALFVHLEQKNVKNAYSQNSGM